MEYGYAQNSQEGEEHAKALNSRPGVTVDPKAWGAAVTAPDNSGSTRRLQDLPSFAEQSPSPWASGKSIVRQGYSTGDPGFTNGGIWYSTNEAQRLGYIPRPGSRQQGQLQNGPAFTQGPKTTTTTTRTNPDGSKTRTSVVTGGAYQGGIYKSPGSLSSVIAGKATSDTLSAKATAEANEREAKAFEETRKTKEMNNHAANLAIAQMFAAARNNYGDGANVREYGGQQYSVGKVYGGNIQQLNNRLQELGYLKDGEAVTAMGFRTAQGSQADGDGTFKDGQYAMKIRGADGRTRTQMFTAADLYNQVSDAHRALSPDQFKDVAYDNDAVNWFGDVGGRRANDPKYKLDQANVKKIEADTAAANRKADREDMELWWKVAQGVGGEEGAGANPLKLRQDFVTQYIKNKVDEQASQAKHPKQKMNADGTPMVDDYMNPVYEEIPALDYQQLTQEANDLFDSILDRSKEIASTNPNASIVDTARQLLIGFMQQMQGVQPQQVPAAAQQVRAGTQTQQGSTQQQPQQSIPARQRADGSFVGEIEEANAPVTRAEFSNAYRTRKAELADQGMSDDDAGALAMHETIEQYGGSYLGGKWHPSQASSVSQGQQAQEQPIDQQAQPAQTSTAQSQAPVATQSKVAQVHVQSDGKGGNWKTGENVQVFANDNLVGVRTREPTQTTDSPNHNRPTEEPGFFDKDVGDLPTWQVPFRKIADFIHNSATAVGQNAVVESQNARDLGEGERKASKAIGNAIHNSVMAVGQNAVVESQNARDLGVGERKVPKAIGNYLAETPNERNARIKAKEARQRNKDMERIIDSQLTPEEKSQMEIYEAVGYPRVAAANAISSAREQAQENEKYKNIGEMQQRDAETTERLQQQQREAEAERQAAEAEKARRTPHKVSYDFPEYVNRVVQNAARQQRKITQGEFGDVVNAFMVANPGASREDAISWTLQRFNGKMEPGAEKMAADDAKTVQAISSAKSIEALREIKNAAGASWNRVVKYFKDSAAESAQNPPKGFFDPWVEFGKQTGIVNK